MMRKNISILILILISAVTLGTCSSDDEEFKICTNKCPEASPGKAESLNLGLPCFSTKEACLEWASKNGYGDKPCIECDKV